MNESQNTIRRPANWKAGLRMGDQRPMTDEYPQDGKVFHCYKRIGDWCYEYWTTTKKLNEIRKKTRLYQLHKSRTYSDVETTKNYLIGSTEDGKPQVLTGKQLLSEAKQLVAKAIAQGLISKK